MTNLNLIGRRLIIVHETDETKRFSPLDIKRLSGGSTILERLLSGVREFQKNGSGSDINAEHITIGGQ